MIRKTFVSVAAGAALVVAPMVATTVPAAADVTPQAVTVYYDASGAPSFASQIAAGVANWNSSVSNVQLVENPSAATLDFYEGSDPSGSYAYTDGHGNGYVFIDYTQAEQYYTIRITAHETGHVLGLPDHYEGPCSELMSGGGPGPSCTNAYPDDNEQAQVEQLWANGKRSRGVMERIDG
ncbi:snapalysin family zinc-dependent metalloprotease [Actinophytocola oryzae]|uniref:Extracellular small neutral protease n=1 Tax=Actinophytocola oryzae TaxID=502181 RepID=A0A4R7VXF3_9PSEU|nr:snapalysin family zinc-dependent metalloprotease [Actinophytocola oryzae]TDV53897.1 snapalysin [Actinophytocola oryzae]